MANKSKESLHKSNTTIMSTTSSPDSTNTGSNNMEEITLPLTPSLAPIAIESSLRMPKLNRLVSNDWPIANQVKESSNGKVQIVSSEYAVKSPTPKANAARVSSFRKLQDSGNLGSIVQPLLFRTQSEMSDLDMQSRKQRQDISSSSSSTVPSWSSSGENSQDLLLPSLQFSLPSESPKNSRKRSYPSILHRDGRRSRFSEVSNQDSQHDDQHIVEASQHPRLNILDPEEKRMSRIMEDEMRASSAKKRFRPSFSVNQKDIKKRRIIAATTTTTTMQASNTVGCSCKRSKCRKKYCLCFSRGVACMPDCRCDDCGNTPDDGLFSGLFSTRGCKCDNSRCRKKYCVCFQDGKYCSPCCKCKNCENQPGDMNAGSRRDDAIVTSQQKKKKTKKKSKKNQSVTNKTDDERKIGSIRVSSVSVVV